MEFEQIIGTALVTGDHETGMRRTTAIWPDATDEQLTQEPEELRAALIARLPGLLAEFREAIESLGFKF